MPCTQPLPPQLVATGALRGEHRLLQAPLSSAPLAPQAVQWGAMGLAGRPRVAGAPCMATAVAAATQRRPAGHSATLGWGCLGVMMMTLMMMTPLMTTTLTLLTVVLMAHALKGWRRARAATRIG